MIDPSSLLKLERMIPVEHFPFLNAFKAFGRVVQGCLSSDLAGDYKEAIKSFRRAYLDLGITVIPKVHIIFSHLEEFFTLTKQRNGLGLYSEQHFESVHHDFSRIWSRFKIAQGNPRYAEKLQKAMVTYNSLHQASD